VPLAVSRPASRSAHCGPVPLNRIFCRCVLSLTPAPCASAPRPNLVCGPMPRSARQPSATPTAPSATPSTPCELHHGQRPPAVRPWACTAPHPTTTTTTGDLCTAPCELHHSRRSLAARPVPLRFVLLLGVVGAGFGHDFLYFVGGAREFGG
jgi:hypothetical protein